FSWGYSREGAIGAILGLTSLPPETGLPTDQDIGAGSPNFEGGKNGNFSSSASPTRRSPLAWPICCGCSLERSAVIGSTSAGRSRHCLCCFCSSSGSSRLRPASAGFFVHEVSGLGPSWPTY